MFAPLALLALTFQNVALVLLMKDTYREGAPHYSTPSAVASSEVLKLTLCALYVSITEGPKHAVEAMFTAPKQLFLAVPCILYTLQNNLLFLAVRSLPVSAYVICSQGKVLTSAFFGYTLLGTRLGHRQILALVFLTFGMIMVQKPAEEHATAIPALQSNYTLGLFCIFLANLTSGFSGAFLEKIYKNPKRKSSVMLKNMQLACFSVPFAVVAALASDYHLFHAAGFFCGYDNRVVFVIVLQAAGGMIVAVVMRYASNILKCFAVSISICICVIVSAVQGRETLSIQTICGMVLVNVSTLLYGSSNASRPSCTSLLQKITVEPPIQRSNR